MSLMNPCVEGLVLSWRVLVWKVVETLGGRAYLEEVGHLGLALER
jgi:hypothetical protein